MPAGIAGLIWRGPAGALQSCSSCCSPASSTLSHTHTHRAARQPQAPCSLFLLVPLTTSLPSSLRRPRCPALTTPPVSRW